MILPSITDTPRKPRTRNTYEVDDNNQPKRYYPPSVDKDASWVKKAGKTSYGFKKHIITDDEGLVIGVKITKASIHDSQVFEDLVGDAKLPIACEVQADKAYKSKRHDEYLNKHKLKNGTQYRASRNKPLTKQQTKHNKQVAKTHTQHVLESIAYNLKRIPNLMARQIETPALNQQKSQPKANTTYNKTVIYSPIPYLLMIYIKYAS